MYADIAHHSCAVFSLLFVHDYVSFIFLGMHVHPDNACHGCIVFHLLCASAKMRYLGRHLLVVFASGHTGPWIIHGLAKYSSPAPHCGAGQGIFFFTPPRAPSGVLHFWGPVFASSRKFPIPGPS